MVVVPRDCSDGPGIICAGQCINMQQRDGLCSHDALLGAALSPLIQPSFFPLLRFFWGLPLCVMRFEKDGCKDIPLPKKSLPSFSGAAELITHNNYILT